MELPGLIVILMGMASGIFGGILRDVMANEIPLIFRRDVYATASLSGAMWVYFSQQLNLPIHLSVLIGFCIVVIIRFAAIKWRLSLPAFLNTASYRKENHPREL
jgi:uncharacterized membrane protein YeiH